MTVPQSPDAAGALRHDWALSEVRELLDAPLNDLIFRAQRCHRARFDPNRVQLSTLLNIKSGGCPEDCAYCPQSARYQTSVQAEPMLELGAVLEAASIAKTAGASRFCMGAAWREPRERSFQRVLEMVRAVKALGLETCVTLGMLDQGQAVRLKEAGLDYYNHNLDTSETHYAKVITTRSYRERLETLANVRDAGISVCCGGIIGLGEGPDDRCELLITLANLPRHPESVPINLLVQMKGTPLADLPPPDPFDMVRTIAVARILMPASYVRLSAGRSQMSDELQALCFLAGANSVFYGERLLTTENPAVARDQALFQRLGLSSAP